MDDSTTKSRTGPNQDSTWQDWFVLLRKFVEREGHAVVPARHCEAGRALGSWVSSQRRRRVSMSAERRHLLELLPGWSWRASMTWDDWVELLEAFVAREGHARVAYLHEERGRGLGIWVNSQRRLHKLDRLDATRAQRLEAVTGWVWRMVADAPSTEDWFELLEAYAAREGDVRVQRDHLEAGQPLGDWVERIRNRYQQGRLPQSVQRRLESMPGWAWRTVPADRPWEAWFEILETYVARERHALVPQGHVEDGASLGRWVARQRALHHRVELKEDRRERLEAVPGWTWQARRIGGAPRSPERHGITVPPVLGPPRRPPSP